MPGLTANDVRREIIALGVPENGQIAVAVSGGADSLALMLLARKHFEVIALTVDHGLRAEAVAETAMVAALCASAGIAHVSLTWHGEKPEGNIQAAAREARYKLMADWCLEHDVSYIATAHHMDDQAETLLLRLARGSGVYGLAGMAPTRELGSVTLIRPLLAVPKTALISYLSAHEIEWVEDPSNQSSKFDRVKIRRLLANPPVEGFRADRLAGTASRLRRSRDALEHYEALWLGRAVEAFPEGYAYLKRAELCGEPEEILLRGLASLCRFAGKGAYVPRMEKLLRLFGELQREDFRGQTLYGAQFTPISTDIVLVSRELRDCEAETTLEDTCSWDNRFEICAKGDIAGLKICALGEEGWRQLKASAFCTEEMQVPRVAALTLPALFRGSDLQAVPHLGYAAGQGLTLKVAHRRTVLTKK